MAAIKQISRKPAIGKILEHCYAHPEVISFAGGIPDERLFPVSLFEQTLTGIAKDPVLRSSLQYTNRYGYAPLRHWIVKHLSGLGIECALDNILITGGSQQLIDLAGKHCVLPGETILAAPASYFAALQSFDTRHPGYDTSLHVNLERSGDAPDSSYNASLAYFVPDFDNPTGVTLELDTRQKIISLAEENDFSIVEDAAYTSIRFEGEDLPSLLKLDIKRAGGNIDETRVIYGGTLSKSLVPGARIGWACAAKPTIDALADLLYAAGLHVPLLTQITMHRVAEQIFESNLGKICDAYRGRRDLALGALEKHMPSGVSWNKPEGGMFIWVSLPEHIDTKTLAWKSLDAGVAFAPAQDFSPHEKPGSRLRLCYSWLGTEKIDPGIELLAGVIRRELESPVAKLKP